MRSVFLVNPPGDFIVLAERQQHMRGPTAVGDVHRACICRFIGIADILVELSA